LGATSIFTRKKRVGLGKEVGRGGAPRMDAREDETSFNRRGIMARVGCDLRGDLGGVTQII